MSRCRFMSHVKIISMAGIISLAAISSAHASVQISRPLDGSTVREVVNILVPVSSVPQDGSVTYTIDGKLITVSAARTDDDRQFVYRWDTKNIDVNHKDQVKVQDGQHTIAVQACDASGKFVEPSKKITVFVKNTVSIDMPSSGLKLRYRAKLGTADKYHFKTSLGIKSVQGVTDIAATLGENVEGVEGVISRSVEDVMAGGDALIRQSLIGTLVNYQMGNAVPVSQITSTPMYRAEDGIGQVKYVISSAASGKGISVIFPRLPLEKITMNSTWQAKERFLQNQITHESAVFDTTSRLDSLEWQSGYPCAKIVTSFSGLVKIPFSTLFKQEMAIKGTRITYFAYQSGKLVSAKTTATVDAMVDQNTVSRFGQSSQGGLNRTGTPYGASRMPAMPMNPAGAGIGSPFDDDMPGVPSMAGTPAQPIGTNRSHRSVSIPGSRYNGSSNYSTKVPVTLELTENIEIIR